MAILLLILKIVGIVLLILICLLLLALCLLAFVPVRYRLKAESNGTVKQLSGGYEASWLLRVLVFQGGMYRGEHRYRLRLFGFVIYDPVAKSKKTAMHESADGCTDGAIAKDTGIDDEGPRMHNENEDDGNVVVDVTVSDDKHPEHEQDRREKQFNYKKRIKMKRRSGSTERLTYSAGVDMDIKTESFIDKLEKLVHHIQEDMETIQRFIQHPAHRHTLTRLWMETAALLRYIRPNRLKGKVLYGFDDPARTGQLTGLICAAVPDIHRHVVLKQDYENEVLRGRVVLSGRIRLYYVIALAVRLFFDRQAKRTYKDVKKLKFKTIGGK